MRRINTWPCSRILPGEKEGQGGVERGGGEGRGRVGSVGILGYYGFLLFLSPKLFTTVCLFLRFRVFWKRKDKRVSEGEEEEKKEEGKAYQEW